MMHIARIAVLAALTVFYIMFYPYLNSHSINSLVRENSVVAPLLFIAICSVKPVLFFLPSMGLTIIGGVLFGALWGTVYVAVGGAFSTVVGYYFARWLGRDLVMTLVRRNEVLRKFEERSKTYGGNAVLYMRLFNLPWDIVSYWAGLSGIKFREFYLASLVPLLPVSFLYTYFGSKIFDPLSRGFIISLAIMFMAGAAPYIRTRWRRTKHA